jgi:hypothetical protein
MPHLPVLKVLSDAEDEQLNRSDAMENNGKENPESGFNIDFEDRF